MANYSGAALFVVATAGSLNAADTEMKDRLEALGYTVTEKSDEDSFLDTDSNWVTGFDVAVVSESCSSSTLGTSGADAAQGIVLIEGGVIDDWNLGTAAATNVGGGDHSSIEISTNHFLGAGLAGNGDDFELTQSALNKAMHHLPSPSSGAVGIAGIVNKTHHISSWLSGADETTGTTPERRVFLGNFRIDAGDPPDEDADGFANNDLGWATFDAAVWWCGYVSLTTDLQLVFPVTEITRTGTWSANAVTDIDDEVPSTAASYASGATSGVLVFRLGTLTDPQSDKFHTLAIAHRRSVTGGTPTLSFSTHRNYVSEGDQGTTVVTKAGKVDSAGTEWGGDIIDLTTTEADTIVGSEYTDDLYVRIAFTADSTGQVQIANIRFIADGAPVATGVYPPFPRRRNRRVRM